MKKKGYVISVVTLFVAAASFFYFNTTSKASLPEEKEVQNIFETYFEAIQSGDIESAMELVIDTRYENAESQRKGYEAAAKEDIIYSINVEGISEGDSGQSSLYSKKFQEQYDVQLAVKNQTNGAFKITLPVVKDEQGEWKILILPTNVAPAS
ncbi:hypothetical protein E6C60_0721 [Paenibacillus algicola]|uniref:DUF4878 domain-containing protein n=1 Tax=Paenibacillus algicola TaxID=2565926 RepID=A0A4P8XG80_9BACL|nr:hypothetical protein [Paenibacillus algicola]QCT01442.1 hypothetical protein E6C60_0721 [Paenibacillus algicola]